jgi:hypothetical protein
VNTLFFWLKSTLPSFVQTAWPYLQLRRFKPIRRETL